MYSTSEGARNQVNHIKSTLQFDEPACLQFTSVRKLVIRIDRSISLYRTGKAVPTITSYYQFHLGKYRV